MLKELDEDRVNRNLKKSSVGCVLPLTNNLRGSHMADMNGYHYKNWLLEMDDNELSKMHNMDKNAIWTQN